jgi:beta-glucanase (GH16 family)
VNRRQFVSLLTGATAATQLTSCTTARPAKRKTISAFSDDFNGPAGSAPDPAIWEHEVGSGGWGNGELEVYTSSRDNSFLDGHGNLVIRATKQVHTVGGRIVTSYRSARIRTSGKFARYHGNFEARIKLDIQPGLWPAWWALGADIDQVGWPACGEVDMLENFGGTTVQTSVHTPNGRSGSVLTASTQVTVDDDWHVWRMTWGREDGGFTFYRDGLTYLTITPADLRCWCFSSGVPLYMVLNLAVGRDRVGPPADVRFPVDMLVDYIRVW